MAILHDKKLEINSLFTMTEYENNVSTYLLSVVDVAHFNFPPTKYAFMRFLSVLQKTGEFLSWDLLCSDQTLDSSYKEILSNADPVGFSVEESKLAFKSLNQYRVARILNKGCAEILEKLDGEFDSQDLVERLSDVLVSTQIGDAQRIGHIGKGNNVTKLVKRILDKESLVPLVKTKFPGFDDVTGGLPRNGLVILAAPTGGGKSALGQQLALNMYSQKLSSVVVTLEMAEEQYMSRVLANISSVSQLTIKNRDYTPDDRDDIKTAYRRHTAFGKKHGCRFSILAPRSDITLTQALMAIKPYNYNVVVLDYIGLFSGMSGSEQWKTLMDSAREAKRFSETNNCLVLMLAQLDSGKDDLKYSKGMRDHADNAWFWSAPKEGVDRIRIKQTKGRDNPLMEFPLKVDFSRMRIWDDNISEVRAGAARIVKPMVNVPLGFDEEGEFQG